MHSYKSTNTQFATEYFEDAFAKFLPEFDMIVQFKRSESLALTYKQEVNFTDVNKIARGIVANNYSSFFAGNAELVNASFHNVALRYSSYNLFNASNVYARVSYRKTANQVNRNTIFEPRSVVSSSTYLNSLFDNENFNAFGRVEKTIKKVKMSLGGNFSHNKTFQFINSTENTNESISKGLISSIGTNFTKAPNVSLRYRVSFVDQSNSARAADVKSIMHMPSVNFDAYIWDSLTAKSDFSYTETRQEGSVVNSFKIWNASLAYRKDNDAKWEYELVGNNLLGTGFQSSVNQGVVSFTVNQTFILPRFVSLRVRYQL